MNIGNRIFQSIVLAGICLNFAVASTVAAQPSPAVPSGDDEPVNLSFDDIKFDIEKDEPFEREMITEEIEELRGKRVSLRGYILPATRQSGIKVFVLVRDNQECCFGPGAALFDCVLVKLEEGHSIDYTVRPVTVEGEFMIKEYTVGDRVMAIFRMKEGVVSQ